MKAIYTLIITLTSIFFPLSRETQEDEWVSLLDPELSKWENYLSYKHKNGYNGKVPVDSNGIELQPIGYNKDNGDVFSVTEEAEEPVLRISGEIYGCLYTREAYENYHLSLKVKWGNKKYEPRKDLLRDSGVLYHSIGEVGVDYWRSWMLSQEFQVMEGHMGDFWCQGGSAIDIRSFPSESGGIMSPVADENQPFRAFNKNVGPFCLRSVNHESAAGEWTTLELICFEDKSLHIVNGHVVMVLKNSRHILSDGREIPLTKGKIQLQSEAAEVFYKDIRIKSLNRMPEKYANLFEIK